MVWHKCESKKINDHTCPRLQGLHLLYLHIYLRYTKAYMVYKEVHVSYKHV
jgi:hypothetical protein